MKRSVLPGNEHMRLDASKRRNDTFGSIKPKMSILSTHFVWDELRKEVTLPAAAPRSVSLELPPATLCEMDKLIGTHTILQPHKSVRTPQNRALWLQRERDSSDNQGMLLDASKPNLRQIPHCNSAFVDVVEDHY